MHVVQRQILDFNIDASLEYFGITEKIKTLYRDTILPGIDGAFSELAADGKVYRFEQLEIDLGNLTPDMPAAEIAVILERALMKTLRGALFDGAAATPPYMQSLSAPGTPYAEQLELLIYFLQTGLFPWWSASDTGTPETLLHNIIRAESTGFADLLRFQATPAMIKRLTRQFDPATLEMLLDEHQTYLWQQIKADLWKVIAVGGRIGLHDDGLREILNRLMLKILLAGGNVVKAEIRESVSEIAQLMGLAPDEMWAKAKLAFLSGAPASAVIRDLIGDLNAALPEITLPLPGAAPVGKKSDSAPPWASPAMPEATDATLIVAALAEGIFIKNAGLVLLAPFFKTFFEKAELMQDGRFLSEKGQERAVQLSQYLVTGQEHICEPELPLNKLLCGWALEKPVGGWFTPTAAEKQAVTELLDSVIGHWTALGNISAGGFCNTFLVRQGKLYQWDQQYKLLVERKAFDILLEKLPWNISLLRSAWMRQPLWVEW